MANVNAIAPGLFQSKMTEQLFEDETTRQQLLAAIPRKTSGAMENIAGLVTYLSSTAGSFTSGAIIPCDGGASTLL